VTSFRVLRGIVRLRRRIELQDGTDVAGTERRIEAGIPVTGERAWLLILSCLLASIGLDTGSAAVIIGAMLISPLMSPILGVGLGTALADRPLLARAFRELLLATAVTLVVSTLYFTVSPLAEPTAEMLARTTPTLLDVGIALFGGVAGIVAGSRRDQSMALPGVAIATALMPPLCTAGFGLATGRPAFFFGALYLYVLNAIFIALATFAVARALRFPLRSFPDHRARQREIRLVTAVAGLAIVPSLYFLYTTVQGARERRRIEQFIAAEVNGREREIIRWTTVRSNDTTRIKVYLAGTPIPPEVLDSVRLRLPSFQLADHTLDVVQSDISARDLERLETDVQREILQAVELTRAASDSAQATARRLVVRSPLDTSRIREIARDVHGAFPEIVSIAYAPQADLLVSDSIAPPPTLFVAFAPDLRADVRTDILTRAQALVRSRVGGDSLRLTAR
jgi:uncharacterized hydrophobic protein (TIGR00271 family)